MNGTAQTLEDEQAQLVRRLSELVDVHVIPRQQGGVDLTVGSGRALVTGASSYSLDMSPGANGYAMLSSQGTALTPELTGGIIGGLLQVRDSTIPSYQASLDTIAFETAAQVNAVHAAGFDLAGNAGGAFFSYSTPPVGVAGAAKALRVDPAIVADPGAIAAASVALPGDNGTARAIAALRDAPVLNGNSATLLDGWGDFVYRIGSDSRDASNARDTHADIVREVDALRDQVSGVSLDEEALNLLKFQRAYEANAKFFTTVDSMLSTLMEMAGR
jgi:flagellar hook-associated protein 1 FlgK